MKILIKIYSNDKTILEDFNSKISNKFKTVVELTDVNLTVPKSLNDIQNLDWDIIIPIYKPFVPVQNFNEKIKEIYKEKFPDLDGVIWLNDGEQKDICTIPVIGKNYYKEFNYIYNPSYNKYNFEKEFTDIIKLKNKYYFVEDVLFKKKEIITDDDKIYEFRKKLNFCLTNLTEKVISNLNKFVDNVYVINLERRIDRLENIVYQFNRFNISFNKVDAFDGKLLGITGEEGCFKSHIGVIENAISNNYNKIAIFEDDIILCDDFEERFKYYSSNIPDDWDIMYLGGTHYNGGIEVKPFIHKIEGIYGCFAMILNNKNGLFQRIIETSKLFRIPIDNVYCEHLSKTFKTYIFVPFFVKTMNTISDIDEREDSFEYEQVNKYFESNVNLSNIKLHEKNMKFNLLNSFVNNVYCINLQKRKDKLIHMMEQFQKIDLDSFQIIKGIDGQKLEIDLPEKRKNEIGCLRSHLSVINDAIEKDYDKIAIFEDDIIFCDDFNNRFEYYIKNVPDDWDIMYFGNNIPVMLNPISMVKEMIYRVWKSKGCFAMILNNKNGLFQKILDVSKDEDKTIDSHIESLFPYIKAYTFLPFFVKISDMIPDIGDYVSNEENINKYFKEIMILPSIKENHIEYQKIVKTQKEMCEEHLKLNGNFVIYFNNNLIFDSSTSSKDNVLFFNEHFEVFGRQFPYRGMFIKRK